MQCLRIGLGLFVVALVATACAPRQQVPLRIDPPGAELYVDGKEVSEPPKSLDLRSDQDHTIFVKSPGHQSELVVLRSIEKPEENPSLVPRVVDVQLRPLTPTGRELVIKEAESR